MLGGIQSLHVKSRHKEGVRLTNLGALQAYVCMGRCYEEHLGWC